MQRKVEALDFGMEGTSEFVMETARIDDEVPNVDILEQRSDKLSLVKIAQGKHSFNSADFLNYFDGVIGVSNGKDLFDSHKYDVCLGDSFGFFGRIVLRYCDRKGVHEPVILLNDTLEGARVVDEDYMTLFGGNEGCVYCDSVNIHSYKGCDVRNDFFNGSALFSLGGSTSMAYVGLKMNSYVLRFRENIKQADTNWCFDPGIIVTFIGSFEGALGLELMGTSESCSGKVISSNMTGLALLGDGFINGVSKSIEKECGDSYGRSGVGLEFTGNFLDLFLNLGEVETFKYFDPGIWEYSVEILECDLRLEVVKVSSTVAGEMIFDTRISLEWLMNQLHVFMRLQMMKIYCECVETVRIKEQRLKWRKVYHVPLLEEHKGLLPPPLVQITPSEYDDLVLLESQSVKVILPCDGFSMQKQVIFWDSKSKEFRKYFFPASSLEGLEVWIAKKCLNINVEKLYAFHGQMRFVEK